MKQNVIFILLDGARWDRIQTSKELLEIVSKGILLNNVTTAIPYTIGSVNATFSGLYGKDNGIDAYYKMFRLKESIKIMPEIMQDNGYFTACDLLTDRIISKRGFDIHQAHNEYKDDLFQRHPEFIKKCINDAKEKPLFLFLHFTRIHTVTVSDVLKKYDWDNEEFYNRKKDNLTKYDSVFDEAGKYSKMIKETLEELGILKNTLLIFFSDHGTGIGERFGERNYGSFTYEETIRSFFLFLSEKIKNPHTSNKLRESIDVFPTVLELINVKNNLNLPGESFAKYILNEEELKEKEYTFSETGALHGPYPSPKEPNVFCIKSPKYKLMYLKTPNFWKFFDLENDPGELNDISGKGIQEEEELKEKLLRWIER
jgi:arylsulfatase A-like enzyme